MLVFRRHTSDLLRKQLIAVLSSTATDRVPGFADVLVIGGTAAMKTLAGEAVIGQLEHVTPRSGGK